MPGSRLIKAFPQEVQRCPGIDEPIDQMMGVFVVSEFLTYLFDKLALFSIHLNDPPEKSA